MPGEPKLLVHNPTIHQPLVTGLEVQSKPLPVAEVVEANLIPPNDEPFIGRPLHGEAISFIWQELFESLDDVKVVIDHHKLPCVLFDAKPAFARR